MHYLVITSNKRKRKNGRYVKKKICMHDIRESHDGNIDESSNNQEISVQLKNNLFVRSLKSQRHYLYILNISSFHNNRSSNLETLYYIYISNNNIIIG